MKSEDFQVIKYWLAKSFRKYDILILSAFICVELTVLSLCFDGKRIVKSMRSSTPKYNPREKNDNKIRENASSGEDAIYISLIDSEKMPRAYHCLMKNIWIDDLKNKPIIDDIEIYSLEKWTHSDCDLSTVVVKDPPFQMDDPSSWILFQSLKLFLERSNTKWFHIMGDANFVDTSKYIEIFGSLVNKFEGSSQLFVTNAGCVQTRYFYNELQISSGMLFSRDLVKRIISETEYWKLMFEMQLTAEEAINHLLISMDIHGWDNKMENLIPNSFGNVSDYDLLYRKDFSNLPICNVSTKMIDPEPGHVGSCIHSHQKINDVIIWNSGNKISKKYFFEKVKYMINNNPDSIGYVWYKMNPYLCRIS